jgi:hypothetical protein
VTQKIHSVSFLKLHATLAPLQNSTQLKILHSGLHLFLFKMFFLLLLVSFSHPSPPPFSSSSFPTLSFFVSSCASFALSFSPSHSLLIAAPSPPPGLSVILYLSIYISFSIFFSFSFLSWLNGFSFSSCSYCWSRLRSLIPSLRFFLCRCSSFHSSLPCSHLSRSLPYPPPPRCVRVTRVHVSDMAGSSLSDFNHQYSPGNRGGGVDSIANILPPSTPPIYMEHCQSLR